MAYDMAVQRILEYKRLYTEVELTEDGVYLLGEVPDSYSGDVILTIEVVFALLQVDISGRLRLQTYNPPDIKNASEDAGLPVEIEGGHQVRVGTGTPKVVLKWRENEYLPEDLRAIAAGLWASWSNAMGEWTL